MKTDLEPFFAAIQQQIGKTAHTETSPAKLCGKPCEPESLLHFDDNLKKTKIKTASRCFPFKYIVTFMQCHNPSPPDVWDKDVKSPTFDLLYPVTIVGDRNL